MKLFQIYKSFKIKRFPHFKRAQYFILHNEEELENVKVFSTLAHAETYKMLREFKTPQYNHIYVLRNKKAFNTVMFQQKYDVVVTSTTGVVIDTISEVDTGFISQHYPNAFAIYFTNVGTINFYNIRKKDTIQLRRDWLWKK